MPTPSFSSLPLYAPSGSRKQWKRLIHITSVSGIDGLVEANSAIITIPTGYSAVVSSLTVRLTALSEPGEEVAEGEVSLINSTDTVDIIASTALTGLLTVGEFTQLFPAAAAPVVAAGKVISFKVNTAYADVASVTLAVDLLLNFF